MKKLILLAVSVVLLSLLSSCTADEIPQNQNSNFHDVQFNNEGIAIPPKKND
ncbi:MAG: hypothetical protein J0L86_01245 [Flavobacteriales bacterium]|nr:hypothetical protein [Flavobacteriales bacterium]